jgi:signal transduction histidine kinase
VLLTRHAVQIPLQGAEPATLSIFPLVGNDGPFGVVEITGDTETIRGGTQAFMPLIEHTAQILSRPDETSPADDLNAVLRLASDLLWARTATTAVGVAVREVFDHLGTPVAGFLPDRDGWGWFLAGSEGLGSRGRSGLRQAVRWTDRKASPRAIGSRALRRRFSEVSGCHDARVVRAGPATLVLGDLRPGHEGFLGGVEALLAGVLRRVGLDGVRPTRDPARELGIAWTAHELRGPLIGAHAALGRASTGTESEARELVDRARDELERLSDLIDPLLRWSTGADPLKRRRLDLGKVTREAVASSGLGQNGDGHRISIDAHERLLVLADAQQLRIAIANVVRNALVHSPAGSPVNVSVEAVNGHAQVVVQDHGPGIPAEEQGSVFDPFTTGRGSSNQGSGLGLFIARRVLEAHAGSIFLRPARSGATVVLELPAERRHPSES